MKIFNNFFCYLYWGGFTDWPKCHKNVILFWFLNILNNKKLFITYSSILYFPVTKNVQKWMTYCLDNLLLLYN